MRGGCCCCTSLQPGGCMQVPLASHPPGIHTTYSTVVYSTVHTHSRRRRSLAWARMYEYLAPLQIAVLRSLCGCTAIYNLHCKSSVRPLYIVYCILCHWATAEAEILNAYKRQEYQYSTRRPSCLDLICNWFASPGPLPACTPQGMTLEKQCMPCMPCRYRLSCSARGSVLAAMDRAPAPYASTMPDTV
jgi:hypothetical protein